MNYHNYPNIDENYCPASPVVCFPTRVTYELLSGPSTTNFHEMMCSDPKTHQKTLGRYIACGEQLILNLTSLSKTPTKVFAK